MRKNLSVILVALLALGGCSLAPIYQPPTMPTADSWPSGEAYTKDAPSAKAASSLKWRDFFPSAQLQRLITQALGNNRDLRLAALRMQQAQAAYGLALDARLPATGLGAGQTQQYRSVELIPPWEPRQLNFYSLDLGLAAWEIDFFNRLGNLSQQALATYLASEEGRRSVQISLISQLARTFFALAAAQENLNLARSLQQSRQASYDLIRQGFDSGIINESSLQQAHAAVVSARMAVAHQVQQVAQSQNALTLLVGAPLTAADWPDTLSAHSNLPELAAGLPSEVLLHRPDVMAAEHRLKGAYAAVGAARAAIFPRISLTATVGSASTALSGLFSAATSTWLLAPKLLLPIFDRRNWAARRISETERQIALAEYEKTVQTAFREVADALAARSSLQKQLAAQQELLAVSEQTYKLTEQRYQQGLSSNLQLQDAQRALLNAKQAWFNQQLAQASNQIKLYAALGGGLE